MNPRTALRNWAWVALVAVLGACRSGAGSEDAGPARQAVSPAEAVAAPVIPRPAQVEVREGRFVLGPQARIAVAGGNAEALRIARDLASRLQQARGFAPQVGGPPAGAAVVLALDPGIAPAGDEAYVLEIAPQGARIAARAPAGLFYGAVTLWQLATAEGGSGPATIAAQRIEDAPRFAWRGLMLDVARHFRTVDEVKALLDQMALHKLNTFHWHLTDDQGWRIEIERYPRLTEVGACRIPAGAAGRDENGKPRPYCGFYTQDEIREVVRYAAERYIAVVPEIDLPGHAQAAIAAYPELGVTGRRPPVSPDWGVHTWLFNVDESTFAFLQHVLDEVVPLFPGRYFHLGGDEAAKDQWQRSPKVQARMRELGLKDEMQLQSWFMGRLGRYLEGKGKRLVGWDEILEGGPPADATVMSWRGVDGAIEAARAGHDVVLSPAPDLYLDHLQSDAGDETPGRLGVIALKDVYAFRPVPPQLNPDQARRVLGAQVNLWTEHQRTNERVQRSLFPRAAALAEAVWTPEPRRDWDDFLRRLAPQMARYRAAGFAASDSAFAVRFEARPVGGGRAEVRLRNQTGFGTIRYTLDGRAPDAASPEYARPLALPLPATVTAAAFAGGRPLGAPRRFVLDARSLRARGGHALRSCRGDLVLRMEDDAPAGVAGAERGADERALLVADVFDPCWIYPDADLGAARTLEVRVGQLPHNFQLWKDASRVVARPASLPGGALEVRLDGCDGAAALRLPLAPAQGRDGLTVLRAPLPPGGGRHDLCFVFASGGHDPLWAIDEVALLPR
ncbi:family 20 glycosylhydrolase [Vulcaniibacterium tengchongense]|uniref:beta-N-acetylhexosaminidase n=1 Tax=Vulcaniibacterium tengchongense TaxID=1273429 RepID=A0A3N4VAN7_9GAMM|nr:family 20 glycosylhydrolase [Vulcaniibacterium tengchongense]RPE80066.1 hexosaminidase [Vulcaniibacterium tengchongense]